MWLLACVAPSDDIQHPIRRGPGGELDSVSEHLDDTGEPPDDTGEPPDDTGEPPDDTGEPPEEQECPPEPAHDSPDPPTEACSYMDWDLSPDGWYLVSKFGTSWDSTTWGGTTTCGWLQATYDYYDCRYDSGRGECLDDDMDIAWVQGHVDHDYDAVIADAHVGNHPEYFYVADSQRFGCGTTLRVHYGSKCLVVFTEDGGPNTTYEGAGYGGRRILDSSPAVIEALGVVNHGWGNSDLVFVEFGKSTDVPGQRCEDECSALAAMAGNEEGRSPWDPDHMTGIDCR
ncbi:MAG TPA: hypothetical protein QGF58_30290 [Myxococcota bacterium]|nr:hypothetical protein [Myxococcota bacterium]